MDRQIKLAKISKWFYKAAYKTGLVRLDMSKKFPFIEKRARKFMNKVVHKDDALFCLPKNEIVINQNIDRKGDTVLPTQMVEYFIDKSGYRALMNYCICRDSNKCKDYPRENGCLFLGEAAKGIHPELARPVSKEEAKEHLRKCREAGLIHLAGKAFLDTIWLDIKPHDKLFTVCSCCPCCCISIAAGYVAPSLTDWFHKMPGVELEVTEDCTACGKCVDVCVYAGRKIVDGMSIVTEQCRACGRCIEVCPNNCISLKINDMDYVKKTIELLSERVDVT